MPLCDWVDFFIKYFAPSPLDMKASITMEFSQIKRFVLGDPLATHRETSERLSIPIGLAVFASDALSSTAYATEEILLALIGTGLLSGQAAIYAQHANLLSLPVALMIGLLMLTVVVSYRQVIIAFPEGGGTYEVSKERLGALASQTAGAALLIDYVLTVAVSISAGVAAITSTGLLPAEQKVFVAVVMVILIMMVNLRGVKESGTVLAFPAYIFIGSMALLIGVGLYRVAVGDVHVLEYTTQEKIQQITGPQGELINMTLFLVVLKAFSHGCAALTGIEAISDGVKAFEKPEYINANKTLVLMGCVLGSIFLGMTLLAYFYQVRPVHGVEETVVSMIARAVFGEGSVLYYLIQGITMVILILAANTSFSGFPRLATILAADGFLPRQLMSLGDRLVFSNGILILGVMSVVLIWFKQADTHSLIPLYAVGVFLSFTLAQAGMVIYHNQERQPGWKKGRWINGIGAFVTGVVTIILAVEKFTEGAWIVLVAIPILIVLFRNIKAHYDSISEQMVLPDDGYCPIAVGHKVIVLVSSLHKGTIPALVYAKSISKDVEAVHISINQAGTQRIKDAWDLWGCDTELIVLDSPYRSIIQPVLDYIDAELERHPYEFVTVVVPEFVTKKSWHNLLHNQTSLLLKAILRFKKEVVVTTVRYHLDE